MRLRSEMTDNLLDTEEMASENQFAEEVAKVNKVWPAETDAIQLITAAVGLDILLKFGLQLAMAEAQYKFQIN